MGAGDYFEQYNSVKKYYFTRYFQGLQRIMLY